MTAVGELEKTTTCYSPSLETGALIVGRISIFQAGCGLKPLKWRQFSIFPKESLCSFLEAGILTTSVNIFLFVQADNFQRQGRSLRRKMWFQNFKVKLIVLIIIIVVIFIIYLSICKGFVCHSPSAPGKPAAWTTYNLLLVQSRIKGFDILHFPVVATKCHAQSPNDFLSTSDSRPVSYWIYVRLCG